MITCLTIVLLATTVPRDSSVADSAATPRVVRRLEPVLVEAGRRVDPSSIETVYSLGDRSLRGLPVDRLADALALQPGVVATGEDLHVRGGRAGELAVSILGIPLNDPQTGRPLELPLFAVRNADLLVGGLDADHVGSLAGELDVQTDVPTATPTGMLRYVTSGTADEQAALARLSGPIGRGLGYAFAAEARFDDLGLPTRTSLGRQEWLGGVFGWRQDNRMLGWGKLASIEHPEAGSIEVIASRSVLAPYNPMFSFDGWVTPTDNDSFPIIPSSEPTEDTSIRYRASDHQVMTDERRLAVIASRGFQNPRHPMRLSLAWLGARSLTSIGLRGDPGYIDDANRQLAAW